MSNWISEHGSEYEVPTLIALHPRLKDQSWHNDACPVFVVRDAERNGEHLVHLWVDHPNPELRECGGNRFFVMVGVYGDVDAQREAYNGDDAQAALNAALHEAEIFAPTTPTSKTMVDATALLSDLGAHYEYPGYIGIDKEGYAFAFGDCNGPFECTHNPLPDDGAGYEGLAISLPNTATAEQLATFCRCYVALVVGGAK